MGFPLDYGAHEITKQGTCHYDREEEIPKAIEIIYIFRLKACGWL